jgi:hypothetical protein
VVRLVCTAGRVSTIQVEVKLTEKKCSDPMDQGRAGPSSCSDSSAKAGVVEAV